MNSKIAIISDIHIGVHKSSEKFLKWDLDYVDFLIQTLINKGVYNLFILGDVFHNRREVSLSAIQTAKKFFEKLTSSGITVDVISGNHDCWNDNDSEVTSISMFTGWSNINVITTPHINEVETSAGLKKYAMIPWGYSPKDIYEKYGKMDVVFGHFEINTFKMTDTQICESGYSCADIELLSEKCFSGHFHLRDHRVRDNGFISYVGSAMPLDWGDYGSPPKAICFYDFETEKIEFVENTVSPRYVKININDLINNETDKLDVAKQIQGNIVKIISNSKNEISPVSITTAVERVNGFLPADIQCDIKITKQEAVDVNTNNITTLNVSDALVQYINNMDTELKDEVLKVVKRIYSMI